VRLIVDHQHCKALYACRAVGGLLVSTMCLALEDSLFHRNRRQLRPFIFIVDTYQHCRTLYVCRAAGGLLIKSFSIYFVSATAFGALCYRYSSAKYKEQ
jgi:hypothetical protein